MKHYIWPESQFDPESVPTPWFDAIKALDPKQKADFFSAQITRNIRWLYENIGRLDEEDAVYLLTCLHQQGCPLWRHEFMNFFVVAKLAIDAAIADGTYKGRQ